MLGSGNGARRHGWKLKMSDQESRVVAIGFPTIQMARGGHGRFSMACGGDTFMLPFWRAPASTWLTRPRSGDDAYSDGMVSMAAAEVRQT